MTIMPRGLRSGVTQIDVWCSLISPSMRDTSHSQQATKSPVKTVAVFLHDATVDRNQLVEEIVGLRLHL